MRNLNLNAASRSLADSDSHALARSLALEGPWPGEYSWNLAVVDHCHCHWACDIVYVGQVGR